MLKSSSTLPALHASSTVTAVDIQASPRRHDFVSMVKDCIAVNSHRSISFSMFSAFNTSSSGCLSPPLPPIPVSM
ncbi:hypothetical protein TrCOL_g7452 [Triparma columacea]|uniref:Uncharacterized protein n=1 Tax=Triparma columacea TaxID=722753 RepID=A0A9W7GKR6_9STRA|nr:hypothetical protein TrCOL_g7452 [Triparma columacea]